MFSYNPSAVNVPMSANVSLGFGSIFPVHLLVPMPELHCLNNCRFEVSFKHGGGRRQGRMSCPCLFFSRIVLPHQGPLWYHKIPRVRAPICVVETKTIRS